MKFYVDINKLNTSLSFLGEAEYKIIDSIKNLEHANYGLTGTKLNGIKLDLSRIIDDLYLEKRETRSLINCLNSCIQVYRKNELSLLNYNVASTKNKAETSNPNDYNNILALWFLIDKPDDLSQEEYEELLLEISNNINYLKEKGWTKDSIDVYINYLNTSINNKDIISEYIVQDSGNENVDYYTILEYVHSESKLVGSTLYTKMLDNSGLSDKKKVDLVIQQMGGEIDDYGMLQLKGDMKFDPDMPPHSDFLNMFAKYVNDSYDGFLLDNSVLDDKMVHQFRYYIDYHNINYIRDNYKEGNMTDEEALRAYVFDENGLDGKLMDAEKSRLHNKFTSDTTYDKYYSTREQNRKKLTPNFHSEFILDGDGNFVSQWNVLEWNEDGTVESNPQYYYDIYHGPDKENLPYTWEEARMQIANTESFNYANNSLFMHNELDSSPVDNLDPDYRKEIRSGALWGDVEIIYTEDLYEQSNEKDDDFSKHIIN